MIIYIIELNQELIQTGSFAVENVGILFLNIMIIPTEAQENQKDKKSKKTIFIYF